LTGSPGFKQVIGSFGSISILKKHQNDIVLGKKNQQVAIGVLPDQPGFSPGSVETRVDPPGQTEFQNYVLIIQD
jgi:hypothetical protein